MGLAVVLPREKWQPKSSVIDSLHRRQSQRIHAEGEAATHGGRRMTTRRPRRKALFRVSSRFPVHIHLVDGKDSHLKHLGCGDITYLGLVLASPGILLWHHTCLFGFDQHNHYPRPRISPHTTAQHVPAKTLPVEVDAPLQHARPPGTRRCSGYQLYLRPRYNHSVNITGPPTCCRREHQRLQPHAAVQGRERVHV
jgi:hypothetical protein